MLRRPLSTRVAAPAPRGVPTETQDVTAGTQHETAPTQDAAPDATRRAPHPPPGLTPGSVSLIVPALDEERSIGHVLRAVPGWVGEVIVVDNGSADGTTEVAKREGARVIREPVRGYGAACLAGIAALSPGCEVVAFMDGDFSDFPEELGLLVAPIAEGRAEMVIGSRTVHEASRAALTRQQRWGNALATWLIGVVVGTRPSDLGPFRVIRRDALLRLRMRDRDYGWTAEMQIKAAQRGLRTVEVPVRYRTRIGRSKVSGTVRGTLAAGLKILVTIARLGFAEARARRNPVPPG